ncbi:major facilitator superfamily domain-containing protein [Sordaria brevicollis]|uniref:Major facilitator superfamily domain-containing protein n=1 Tax=Sordaria brevicollis TaxID=83679 RepID=A0AAE0UD52_SORBR|nr:major facilitator superfamily domain-containing protein [Sordaria brevicollis]
MTGLEVIHKVEEPRESSSIDVATATLTRESTFPPVSERPSHNYTRDHGNTIHENQEEQAGNHPQQDSMNVEPTVPTTQGQPVPTQTVPAPLLTGEPPSEALVIEEPPRHSIHSTWAKRLIIFAASISAFFSPLTAQIYLPALPTLADDFNVTATTINLTVTTYMIFQGITPMFLGGFADTAGRRPAYMICFVIYIAANIGLAMSKSFTSLLVLRMLQSAGSAATVALNQATMADITTSAERGNYVGITSIPTVLAPSLGPVLGGVLTNYLGWRWIFWVLTIMASVNLFAMVMFFPETCRKIVGDGSGREKAHWIYWTGWQLLRANRAARRQRRREAHQGSFSTDCAIQPKTKIRLAPANLLASLLLLFRSKELAILLGYSAIVFSGFYAIGTAMPNQLATLYGLNDVQIGLMYLPMAGGSIVTAFTIGKVLTWNFHRHTRRLGIVVDKTRQTNLAAFPIERARLEVGLPLLALTSAVMISWGWAMQAKSSTPGGLAAPCVLLFLLGIGMIGFNNSVNALIADIHSRRAGAATAANNLTRCLLGAASSAAILPMVNGIGSGWAYTLFGALYVGFAPLLWVVMARGVRWRAEETRREEEREQVRQQEERVARERVLAREGAAGVQA